MRPAATCWLATLPIVVVLPTPLTPTNSHTFGRRRRRRSAVPGRRRRGETASRRGARRAGRRARSISLALTLARRPSSSSVVTCDADVGAQQRLLELVPGLVGDPAAPEDRGEHAGQRGTRPRHAAAQGGRFDDLDGRRRRWCPFEHRRRGAASLGWSLDRRRRHGGAADRSRPAAPTVPDDDAEPEGDDDDDEDEVDPDHRRSTLTVGRRLRRPTATTGQRRVRRSARSVRRSPCSTRPAAS